MQKGITDDRDLGENDRDDESVRQDEESAEQENQASDERLGGEPSETSSEQSPDADNVGDSAPREGQDDPPIAEPSSANATSGANNLGQTGSEIDSRVEVPPPELLPQSAIASDSLIASPAETAGITFGESSSEASVAGPEPSIPDPGESIQGPPPSDLGQAVFFDTDPTKPPTAPPSDVRDDSPLDSQPDSRSIRRPPPFILEVGNGERRAKKRLELEVEVTLTNQERIALIASNKTLGTFSQLATTAVHKVAQDLRTFRESYRSVWGRRF